MKGRHGRFVTALAVVAGGVHPPPGAAAQETKHPLEGERLRVTVWNTPLPSQAIGTLTVATADTLVLALPAGPDVKVATDRILQLERSIRPERPNGGRDGFLLGSWVGVALLKTAFDAYFLNDELNLPVAVIVGVPLGGLIGAIIGSERAQEQWEVVHPRPTTQRKEGGP